MPSAKVIVRKSKSNSYYIYNSFLLLSVLVLFLLALNSYKKLSVSILNTISDKIWDRALDTKDVIQFSQNNAFQKTQSETYNKKNLILLNGVSAVGALEKKTKINLANYRAPITHLNGFGNIDFLKKIEIGDKISITNANGKLNIYKIVALKLGKVKNDCVSEHIPQSDISIINCVEGQNVNSKPVEYFIKAIQLNENKPLQKHIAIIQQQQL